MEIKHKDKNKRILLHNLMDEDEITTLQFSLRLSELEELKKNQMSRLRYPLHSNEVKDNKKYIKLILQNNNIIDLLNHKNQSDNRIKNKKKK